MTLKEPIVEWAYYEREDGQVVGPAVSNGAGLFKVGQWLYHAHGVISRTEYGTTEYHMPLRWQDALRLTRRVYLVPVDPAEVVAELRQEEKAARFLAGLEEDHEYGGTFADGMRKAARIVESMLGLARCGEGCDGNCELTAPGPTKAEFTLERSGSEKLVVK